MSKIYVIGSLRNPAIPQVAEMLRGLGHEVFDDWYAAGPEADDYWQKYERAKGSSFAEALAGFAAQHVFAFDKKHLDACDIAVMVMPAGKSAHLELGYCKGLGKQTVIFMDKEPERFDVMYNFADKVCTSDEELIGFLGKEIDTPLESLSPSDVGTFPLPTPREQFYADADAANVAAPVAPAEPAEGWVLVPKRMTQEMRDVTDSEGWTWEDLLAEAGSISQEEYAAIAAAPMAPVASTLNLCTTCTGCDRKELRGDVRACTGYQRK